MEEKANQASNRREGLDGGFRNRQQGGLVQTVSVAMLIPGGGSTLCTGILISPHMVLTAAHCIYAGNPAVLLSSGVVRMYAADSSFSGSASNVARAEPHPTYSILEDEKWEGWNFSSLPPHRDLAVIQLTDPLSIHGMQAPYVRLPTTLGNNGSYWANSVLCPGADLHTTCHLIVTLNALGQTDQAFDYFYSGSITRVRDSGGPIFLEDAVDGEKNDGMGGDRQKPTLYALVSRAKHFSGRHARVDGVSDWILSWMREFGD